MGHVYTSKNDYMHVFRRPLAVASVPRAAQAIPGVASALAAVRAPARSIQPSIVGPRAEGRV
jgi:hypothetical protein